MRTDGGTFQWCGRDEMKDLTSLPSLLPLALSGTVPVVNSSKFTSDWAVAAPMASVFVA